MSPPERAAPSAWQDGRVRLLVVIPVVCLLLPALSACSQKVLVRASDPDARVSFGDAEGEPVPEEGLRVEVEPGLSPVPFVVEGEAGRREGVVERTEVDWAWVGAGVTAAACCAPSLVAAGACLANPALAPALVGCVVAVSPAPCCATLAAPSWATVLAAGSGALLGLTPLSLALLSERVPDEVVLDEALAEGSPEAPARAEVPY